MICTSPMPMAGFTITIRRSEAIDLNLTLDQAIQFIVSCGVVIPPKPPLRGSPLRPRLATPGSEAPPEPTFRQEG
jgi:uncharacterized membrane protein